MNKYGNRKIIYDGIDFDSKKECHRYIELKLLEKAGEIKDLQRQVKYTLIPSQKDDRGKIIERPCAYMADFVYFDCRANQSVVEDVKGVRTKDYIIKRKLMLYVHGIRIVEI